MRTHPPKNTKRILAGVRNCLLVVLSLAAGLAVCEAVLRLGDTRYEQIAEPPLRKYLWANTYPHPDAKTEHEVLYNRFGNRQHRDFSERDFQTGIHIALFGDSLTEGIYLPVQYSFAEVLDHLLNTRARREAATPPDLPINVHNFGVWGTGPGHQYLRYRDFAHKDRFRHVFYMHSRNDFSDLRWAGLFSLSATGDLVKRTRRPTSVWRRFLSSFRLTYLALDVWPRFRGSDSAVPRARPQATLHGDLVFEEVLSRWRDEVEANGSAFHVVLTPLPHTAVPFHSRVRSGLFDVVDLRDCFEEHIPDYDWGDWRFQSDGHFNEGGNMVVAHCLYRFLEGRLGFERAANEALAQARYTYYRSFLDDAGWPGHRFMPSAPWASPVPVGAAEVARIRAKYLALKTDDDGQRPRIAAELRQGEPLVQKGGWDVFASPRHRLVMYVKSPCGEGANDPAGRLFLHGLRWFKPDDTEWQELRFRKGFWRDGRDCVAAVSMQKPLFTKLRTGEYRERPGGAVLWEAEFPFDSVERVAAATTAYRLEYDDFADAARKVRAPWDIHVLANRVAFLKHRCGADDQRGSFFLRMWPVDPGDATGDLVRGGFALRSLLTGSVTELDGKCMSWTHLPNWRVATILAGQRDGEAVLWETTFHVDVERHQRAWAAVRSNAPAARSVFDVYRRDADLVYARESCEERDTAPRFYLHVFARGSRANLDFHFLERGVVLNGRCVAVVRLPEQDIDRIRTGQFAAGEGNVWGVEI